MKFPDVKPKVYKKSLYIGKKRIFKFTKEYTYKALFKAVWILMFLLIILTMILGGIGMMMNQGTTNTGRSIPINFLNNNSKVEVK